MFRPHLWPVAHSLIPCPHEYTAAHMAGWVLGQNTVDPHRPTHSHTLYAYKAYCAPTHICTVYIQTGPIYMLLAHSMSHSTCTQHEQRTCTQRAQRALRHAPRRMYAIACLTSAYIRRRRKLIYLLVSSRADKERRALPRHTTPHAQVTQSDLANNLTVRSPFCRIIEIDCDSWRAVYIVSIFVCQTGL